MARVRAQADRTIPAPPARVYEVLADYREGRPRLLTDNFSNYRVEQGGRGAGTIAAWHFAAGGRERDYHMEVSEPGPHTLVERDANSSLTTTWTVEPAGEGSRVQVVTEWEGASGIGGFFEKTFAPAGLRKVYAGMLDNLQTAAGTG